jgi:hypothetical protein
MVTYRIFTNTDRVSRTSCNDWIIVSAERADIVVFVTNHVPTFFMDLDQIQAVDVENLGDFQGELFMGMINAYDS